MNPNAINRFSSRRERLDHAFLSKKLAGAKSYRRIAGYFRSSIFAKLHDLLTSGRVEIRVVPKDRVFIHGKAGVVEAADGSKICFLGSINEIVLARKDVVEKLSESW